MTFRPGKHSSPILGAGAPGKGPLREFCGPATAAFNGTVIGRQLLISIRPLRARHCVRPHQTPLQE